MKDDKKKLLFDKFCEKVKLVNPNLEFNIEDWIPQSKEIKGKCLLHDKTFFMFRTKACFMKNCPDCKRMYKKDELRELDIKFDEIDKKYDEIKIKEKEEKLKLDKEKVIKKYDGLDKNQKMEK